MRSTGVGAVLLAALALAGCASDPREELLDRGRDAATGGPVVEACGEAADASQTYGDALNGATPDDRENVANAAQSVGERLSELAGSLEDQDAGAVPDQLQALAVTYADTSRAILTGQGVQEATEVRLAATRELESACRAQGWKP